MVNVYRYTINDVKTKFQHIYICQNKHPHGCAGQYLVSIY